MSYKAFRVSITFSTTSVGMNLSSVKLMFAAVLLACSAAAQVQVFLGQARVVDCDTIAFGDQRIRPEGIDAPEK